MQQFLLNLVPRISRLTQGALWAFVTLVQSNEGIYRVRRLTKITKKIQKIEMKKFKSGLKG